ncbi:MAG: YcjF family protein [Deltaproteobacteria bacterium]|nr:YcjF family protein [Deltaproteobacteria bacterium]
MKPTASRILKYLLLAIAVLAVLIVLFINHNLASLADMLYPGSMPWAHGILLIVEGAAFFWFWRAVFGGREHLLYADDDTPEGRQAFALELARRLRTNPHLREAGIAPPDPDDTEGLRRCLALLNEKADGEIEQSARRIFLATALSQNGKLDALIVFTSLCRLVWRISAIYNQRPHPREILSLYWAVVTTTFLALSLEELDITTEIGVGFGQALHAMAPAGLTASIPFAGKALQTVTSAAIDGTANCYLALRAGIITRNAFAYAFAAKRPSRAAVFREAGGLLLSMSTSLMDKLGVGVADALTGAVRTAQTKTVRASRGIVRSIGAGFRVKSRETDQGESG